jgi:hypothetical protein
MVVLLWYGATMQRNGPKKKVTIVLPDIITEAMKTLAQANRRSLNAEIVWALERYIDEESGQSVHDDR